MLHFRIRTVEIGNDDPPSSLHYETELHVEGEEWSDEVRFAQTTEDAHELVKMLTIYEDIDIGFRSIIESAGTRGGIKR